MPGLEWSYCSSVCDITFENEVAFKDHFLATIHNCGLPSEGKLGRQGKLQSQIFWKKSTFDR